MVATTIFWQNTNGQASIWDLSGTSISGGGPVSPSPGPTWSLIGATGDFIPGATSLSEILWQNANGQISIWEMDGNNPAGGGAVRSRKENLAMLWPPKS